MANDKNLQGVYNTLKKEGYTPPEYSQFVKDMQDDKNLQGVYNTLKEEGYTPPEYAQFKIDMFGEVQYASPAAAPVAGIQPAGAEQGSVDADGFVILDSTEEAKGGRLLAGTAGAAAAGEGLRRSKGGDAGGVALPSDAGGTAAPGTGWSPYTGYVDAGEVSRGVRAAVRGGERRMQELTDNARRNAQRYTPEGRQDLKMARQRAQIMGAPTGLTGLTPGTAPENVAAGGAEAPAPGQSAAQAAGAAAMGDGRRVSSGQGAVPYDVKIVDGKPVTEWLLPDGRLTTDLLEADRAETVAREGRMEHQFINRMKQNGLDPGKPEDWQLQELHDERDRINRELDARRKELDGEDRKNTVGGILRGLAEGGRSPLLASRDDDRYNLDERYGQLAAAARANATAISVLDDVRSGRTDDFWLSLGKELVNGYTFGGALPELRDHKALMEAAEMADAINAKNRNNEQLTAEEQAAELLLKSFASKELTNEQYGSRYGAWSRAGKMAAHSLELMPDFLLGGSAITSKATALTLGKLGLKGAAHGLKKKLLKATGVTLGTMAGGALMAGTVQAPRLAAGTAGRMTGKVRTDEDGNFFFDEKEGFVPALLKTGREMTAENASEAVGAYIPGVGKALGNASRKLMDMIGLKRLNGALSGLRGGKLDKFYKGCSLTLEQAGFNGTVEEGLEEYAGTLYQALMFDLDGIRSLGELDTHVDIWLGCATMGGLLNVPRYMGTGVYGVQYARQKHALHKAGKRGAEAFGDDAWSEMAKTLDEAPNEEVAWKLCEMLEGSGGMTARQLSALTGYAGELQRMRGFHIGELAMQEREDGEPVDAMAEEDAEDAFDAGYDAPLGELAKAERRVRRMREALVGAFGEDAVADFDRNPAAGMDKAHDEESRVMAEQYAGAAAELEGMRQRREDEADRKREAVSKAVEDRTHRRSGVIQPVVLKFDGKGRVGDREVYLVGGNVVLHPDGTTVDVSKSDKQLIYFDKETGMSDYTSPDRIERMGEAVDPQIELAGALAEIEAERKNFDEALANAPESVTLQEDETKPGAGNGNGSEQDNDEREKPRQDDGGSMAADPAGGVASNRDRGHIRMYEEGLAAERDGDSGRSERNRREAESERLVEIARRNGQYIDRKDFDSFGERKRKPSGESVVYINQEQGKIYKVKDPAAKSPMKGDVQPEDVVYEHLVHNKYFPETAYGFEGISDDMGDVRIVLSQDLVESPRQATKEEIEKALAEKGLLPEGGYRYGNEEVSVTDVTGDNALLGIDGKVYFIDPIINFKRPVIEILGGGAEAPAQGQSAADAGVHEGVDAVSALSRIPLNKKGKPDFAATADAGLAWDALVEDNEGDVAAAQEIADFMVGNKEGELSKAEKVKLKGNDPSELKESRKAREAAIAKAHKELEAWQRIAAVRESRISEAERAAAEAEVRRQLEAEQAVRKAERQARDEERAKRPGDYAKAMAGWEDPTSLGERVIRDLVSGGIKLRWSDRGRSHGLGAHLFGGRNTEKRWSGEYGNYKWLIDDADGLLPEEYAEQLCQEFYNDYERDTDHYSEVFGEVLDVLRSYASSRDMWKQAQELHKANAEAEAAAEDFERMEMEARGITDDDIERDRLFRETYGMPEDEWEDFYAAHGAEIDMTDEEYKVLISNLTGLSSDYEYESRLQQTASSAGKQGGGAEVGGRGIGMVSGQGIHEPGSGVAGQRADRPESGGDVPVGHDEGSADAQQQVEPTEAQKKAGNYKMKHVRIDGYDISIENEKGSIRRGKDANGTEWESEIHSDYGYIRGTEGVDGDHIDVFLSDTPEQGDVFVVDQYNPDGSFDEHKVMYGFADSKAALNAYLANYEQGWEQTRRLDVTGVSKDEFKKWIQSSKRKTKPFAEYKNVKPIEVNGSIGRSLTEQEATELLSRMEANAETAPIIDLTPDNWIAQFGEDGLVETPIGVVKMGENQYFKMAQRGRDGKLGMVKPTLDNPDVIIEDYRPASDGKSERDTSYVFIKTFVNDDGSRYYHFTSVTVKKEGHEVVISNQERSSNRISKLLQYGEIAWINSKNSLHPTTQVKESVPLNDSRITTSSDNHDARLGINSSVSKLSPDSEVRLTETPIETEGPDLVPTSDNISSDGKVNTFSADKQINEAQSDQTDQTADESSDKQGGDLADIERIVDVFRKRYGGAQVVVVRSGADVAAETMDDESQRTLSEEIEDSNIGGWYCRDNGKIYIFADGSTSAIALRNTLLHENLHAMIAGLEIPAGDVLRDFRELLTGSDAALADLHADITEIYAAEECDEEFFAYVMPLAIMDKGWARRMDALSGHECVKTLKGLSDNYFSKGHNYDNKTEHTEEGYVADGRSGGSGHEAEAWDGERRDDGSGGQAREGKTGEGRQEVRGGAEAPAQGQSSDGNDPSADMRMGDAASGHQARIFLSEREYVDSLMKKAYESVGNTGISKEDWEKSEDWEKVFNKASDGYPEYILSLAESGELQKMYDSAALRDRIKIRNGIDTAGLDFHDYVDTSKERKEAKRRRDEKRRLKTAETMKAIGITPRMQIGDAEEGNKAVYEVAKGLLEAAGIRVHEVSSEEAQAMLGRNARLSAAKRRALETAMVETGSSAQRSDEVGSGTKDHQGSVTTFDDSAKIQNNLNRLADKYDSIEHASEKTICGELSAALGLRNNGNHSNYGTFEARNGAVVRIRISDHNAEVKNFDDAGYVNGISIVVSRKPNDGLTDNGDAHIVEYYYNGYKLAKADGHPLAEIARSMQQVLFSGEYKDTTGLAERQEVNGDDIARFSIRTYHGTGADFDAFDFSHIGEGEGAQSFGWGGYVTEVKGIGKTYASNIAGGTILPRIEKAKGNIRQVKSWLKDNQNWDKYERKALRHLRELQKELKTATKEGNAADVDFYQGLTALQEENLKKERHQALIEEKLAQIASYERTIASLEEELSRSRHLYTVRIPDDNGSNYLDWDKPVTDGQRRMIGEQATAEGVELDFYGDRLNAYAYLEKMGDEAVGFQVYRALIRSLGSDRAASEFLSRAGLTGMKYAADHNNGGRADGKKNYVVFKESDMKITDHVRFLRNGDGTVYGWIVGGEVYLNKEAMNPETPLHEYTHLWDAMVQRENPGLWNRGKGLMKEIPLWDEVMNDPNYADIRDDEDAVASEVHSRLTGKRGAEILDGMISDARREGSLAEAETVSLVSRLRGWLREMFDGLKKTLGKCSKRDLRGLSVDDFVRMTLRDLADGMNPTDGGLTEDRRKESETQAESDGNKTKFRDGESDGERLLAIHGLEPIEVESNNLSKAELQEIYRSLPSVEKDGREVEFYHSAFKKIYKDGGLFGQIVPVLDEVLEQSVLAYSEDDNLGGMVRPDGTVHKEHPNTISFDNYVGKVNIGGEEYFVRTTIQNDKGNRSGMHSCFVTNVEVYKNTAGETTSTEIPRVKSAADGIVDAKLQQFFERASAELLPHDMRARAMELSEKLHTPIKLVDSADEAMDDPGARHRRAKGWVTDKGEIVVIVPNHSDVADIENTVMHEIVGHDGLEAMIGSERMDEFVTEVYDHAGQGIKKKIDAGADKEYSDDIDRMTRQKGGGVFAKAEATARANAKKRDGHYQREATKEYMADMAGEIGDKGFEKMSQEEQTLWGKIKAKVQQFLDKFLRGLKIARSIRLTDKDLAYILYKAWKHKRENGVFAKAEDIAMRHKTGWGESQLVEVTERERRLFREDKVAVRFKEEREDEKNKPTWKETCVALTDIKKESSEDRPDAHSDSLSHAEAPRYLENLPKNSDAKVQKVSENLKLLSESLSGKPLGKSEIVYAMSQAIGVAKPDSGKSNYTELKAGRIPATIRISNHSGEPTYFNHTGNNVGVVIKTSSHNFRNDKSYDYVEFVYYGDKVDGNASLQRSIIDGLRHYIETGSFEKMPEADRLNTSGRYRDAVEGLDGAVRLHEDGMADKIEGLFDEAVSGKLTGKPVEVGKLTAEGKSYLEKLSGQKFKDDVSFVLNPSDLVHMHRDHFGDNEKDKGNSIPLTKEDIRAIANVISHPQRVIFGVEPDGLKRKLFYFLAPAAEGTYNLLEIYGDRKGNFTAKTFYKTKKAVSQRVLSLMKSEHLTSVTDGASLSDAKLPKFFEYAKPEDETEYHFRDGGMPVMEGSIASEIYEKGVASTFANNLSEGWYDYLRSVRIAQEAIAEERGRAIEDHENVYLNAQHKSSVDRDELDRKHRELVEPLMKAVDGIARKHGVSQLEIERYMNAKHGPERNVALAARDAEQAVKDSAKSGKPRNYNKEYAKNRMNDYSGLTALFDPGHEGKSVAELEAEAERAVEAFEKLVGKKDIDLLWRRMRALTDYTLEKTYTSGRISLAAYEELSARWKWYVPLRDWRETTAHDIYDYVGRDTVPVGAADKKAAGRRSEAGKMLANAMSMLDSAIVLGNKNNMKQKLLNLALKGETKLLSVSNQWYVKRADGTWEAQYPDIRDSMSADESLAAIGDFERLMEAEERAGRAKRRTSEAELPVRLSDKREVQEHAVRVSRGGVEYLVWVNGNPKLAQAVNGLLNYDANPSGALKFIENINRRISRNVTAMRPDFLMKNFARDVANSAAIMGSRRGMGYVWRMVRNLLNIGPWQFLNLKRDKGKSWFNPKGIRVRRMEGMYVLYWRYRHGKLNMDEETDRLFAEFMRNGGETGYSQILRPDDYQKEIDKLVKRVKHASGMKAGNVGTKALNGVLAGGDSVNAGVNAMFDFIELLNRGVENSVRFAAYMTSRQMGYSILQSVADAKEASVNFNRKGSGAMGNRLARSMWIFVNPGVQGVVQYFKELSRGNFIMPSSSLMLMIMGALMPVIYKAFGLGGGDDGEPEGYFGLDYYTRRSNICIYAGNENWFKWPLSQEQSMFYGIGEVIGSHFLCGKGGHESPGVAILSELSKLQPIDVVDGKMVDFGNDESAAATAFRNLLPTGLGYIADAYVFGTDFAGRRIANTSEYNSSLPEWRRAKDDAVLTPLSRELNRLSGGNAGRKGWIDFNPSKLEYAVVKPLGGLAEVPVKLYKTVRAVMGDEDYRTFSSYPIAGSVMKDAGTFHNRHRMLLEEINWWKGQKTVIGNQIKASRAGGPFEEAEVISDLLRSGELNQFEYLSTKDKEYGKQPLSVIKDLERERWDAINAKDKAAQAAAEAKLVAYGRKMIRTLRSFEALTPEQKREALNGDYWGEAGDEAKAG